ncbi:DUF4430 domain-containing protein [Crassaminicella thermophila]|uniref:DUF4430 domain-containing protein n=1 Tax=Crassaminicella thermophila TaxID=2599308 RepID=A0A5C0SDQ1_CRATE|nr:S-layer homology domain-containing protein [Crassaminicella thermophila]QEK11384.1 DUF4430 domain-containing protein [Crassaminicella thermophila]
MNLFNNKNKLLISKVMLIILLVSTIFSILPIFNGNYTGSAETVQKYVYDEDIVQEDVYDEDTVQEDVYDEDTVQEDVYDEDTVQEAVYSSVYSDLATQAVRNHYKTYKNGKAVDGKWGNFGAYDAYILAEAGANLESWTYNGTTFKEKVDSLIDATIANEDTENKSSAKRVAQEYLAAKSLNESDKATQLFNILKNRQKKKMDHLIQAFYSMYSNVATYELLVRAGKIMDIDTDKAIEYILKNQDVNGSWPIQDVDTYIYNDFMMTAQAVRVLKALEASAGERITDVENAIEKGKKWLKEKQKSDGSFVNGYDDIVTDTAEIIYTLKDLGIDPDTWTSEDGNSPVDYMKEKALKEGSFGNVGSTTWALDAYLKLGGEVLNDTVLGIKITPESANITKGNTKQYKAEAYKLDGTIEDISDVVNWSTANNEIATVDNGLVTGVSAGTTEVKAIYKEFSDTSTVIIQLTVIDELAVKAVRNNYETYKNGKAVDGGWGNFGAYDAYILAEAGANLESWTYNGTTFKEKVDSLIDATIANEDTENKSSAKRVAQEYLAAKSLNESDKATQLFNILKNRQKEDGSFDTGLYSMYSNVATYELLVRAGKIMDIDTDKAIEYILKNQDVNGSWPIQDVDTYIYNDFMMTAQAVRVLKALEASAGERITDVENAIEKGKKWLKEKQKSDGSFVNGYDDIVTDTAEIIYTLKDLGIDPDTWTSEDGNSPVDYMKEKALKEGSFGNVGSTTWALDAYLKLGGEVLNDTVLGIKITPESANITKGNTKQYKAEAYKLDGTIEDISDVANWSTANNKIATVDNGLVTGVSAGTTEVKASYQDCSGIVKVNVSGDNSGIVEKGFTVKVAVIGKSGELLYGPSSVTISKKYEYKDTALSALDATGLRWKFSNDWPGMVNEIEGQKNKGMNGWMYAVNGKAPSVLPGEKTVKKEDKILWWYSTNAMSEVPKWPDSSNKPTIISESKIEEKVKETLDNYNKKLEKVKDKNSILNIDKKMTQKEAEALKKELDKNKVSINKVANNTETVLADSKLEVSLLIPKKALDGAKKITISELEKDENPKQFAVKVNSSTYEFGPSGTKFDKPVTISIKLAITDEMNIEKISPAWYDEESKKWIPIPGIIDAEKGLVVFNIDHFTKFAVIELPNKISFKDVDEKISWAKDAIEILAGKGIIKGTGNGFEPQRSITRAEFISLVVTALNLEKEEYIEETFSDVNKLDWFANAVGCAYKSNIISGDPDGKFRPNDPITRNEIASILYRLQGSPENSIKNSKLSFKDINTLPSWAINGVKYVYQQGLMSGYEDETFRGGNALTRAEAAVVIYNYLK